MKTLLSLFVCSIGIYTASAQNIQPTSQKKQKSIQDEAPITIISDWAMHTDTLVKDSTKTGKTDTTELKIGGTRVIIIGEPKIERIEKIKEEENESAEKEEEKIEKEDKRRKNKKVNADFFNFDLGFLYLRDPKNTPAFAQLELQNSKSIYVDFHLVDVSFSLYKNYLQACTGVGLEYNNYRFAKNITIVPNSDSLKIVNESINFEKNKLLTRYLTIPLMLKVETNPKDLDHSFHIAAGVEMGYLLGAKTKQISNEHGKVKRYDDFNAQPLTYDIVGMIGYGSLSAFVKFNGYGLDNGEIFRNSLLPGVNMVSFGISTSFSQ